MKEYRKKPVVIRAVQITDATFDGPHPSEEHVPGVIYSNEKRTAVIKTLEGVMTARVGDWIIEGIAGELYPCQDAIFKATYDAVE